METAAAMALMLRPDQIVSYNGASYGRVTCRMSMVLSAPAHKAWQVAAQFGNMGSWLGSVDGEPILTQLLGGHTVDHIGALRAVSIADKRIIERLTQLDSRNLTMPWQVVSHPLAINPFPASYLNSRASITISPVLIPGNQCFMDWQVEFLTELHAMDLLRSIIKGMLRVGMLNIQKHFTSERRPQIQKKPMRTSILPPISETPQPQRSQLAFSSAFSRMSVSKERPQEQYTGMSAPMQEPTVLNPDKIHSAASYMEMTVPLLFEARPAGSYLRSSKTQAQPAQAQCGSVSPEDMLRAQSGQSQRRANAMESQLSASPPESPEHTEGLLRMASTEHCRSIGSGDRAARRSSSEGEAFTRGSVWRAAEGLHMARSASQPLD